MSRVDHGYSVYSKIFERREVDGMLESLSGDYVERTKAGARRIVLVPGVREMANDPRLLAIDSDVAGARAVPFRATLFDKSATANWLVVWHQDTALPLRARCDDGEWGPWSTKAGVIHAHAPAWALEQVVALRVSLDDSTATNGPLRVLPDTHRGGVFSDEQIEQFARHTAPVDCVTAAGGVVAMRPLTIHASSKSVAAQPRRVLHIEYAATVNLESD